MIAIMVGANIMYLVSLYYSIKEQTIQTATQCLRRADILEIISRMNGTGNGTDESFIRLTLMIQGEKSADGGYDYPNLTEKIDQTMSSYFHFVEANTPDMKERNDTILSEIFREELNNVGLYPKEVTVSSNITNQNQLWRVTVNDTDGQPLIYGYVSPMTGYIFNRMSGIVVTSSVILMLMSFLIWYLLHWVGKLRSIEQMKEDFTHNMTHELKTPVAVAYSAADSMLRYYDQSDAERNKKLLTIIMQRLSYLGGMIENILSMSMERFKTMQLNIEKVEIKPLVEEVAGMIEMKADKPIKIEVDVDDNAVVETDSLHFGNLISNLLDNAVKYSGETVNIKISGDRNKVMIADNGIGISKDHIRHIFDKFYRVTDGDKYEVGGYGLGLYYVKQIADMQGWSISVDSTVGRGSVFTLNFGNDEKR